MTANLQMESFLSTAFFWATGTLLLMFAFLVVLNRNPVASALSLVMTMIFTAALMIQLGAYFLGTIQILVYAGAVMVLFLFIIMLLDLKTEVTRKFNRVAVFSGLLVGSVLISLLIKVIKNSSEKNSWETTAPINDAYHLGQLLFGKYLLPFEITSVLLLVAMIGVILLCKQNPKKNSPQ